jgi:hypothetical protein
MFLMTVVQGDDRLVEEGHDPSCDAAVSSLHHLRRGHPGLKERNLDLGVPPVALGLSDAAEAVAVCSQPALDNAGTKALRPTKPSAQNRDAPTTENSAVESMRGS